MKINEGCSSGATHFTGFEDSREAVLFSKIPIPPSSNNQYVLVRRGGKTYHVPSQELTQFKKDMSLYPALHANAYLVNRHIVQKWVKERAPLEVRAIFFFERKRILTLDNLPKRMDCSNRLKALHDCLAEMLGIDDKWFFRIFAEKAICGEGLSEQCCVEILPIL